MIGPLFQNRVAPMDARLHHALRYPIASEGASRVSDRIPPPATKPRLSDLVRAEIRRRNYSPRTEKAYLRGHRNGAQATAPSARDRSSESGARGRSPRRNPQTRDLPFSPPSLRDPSPRGRVRHQDHSGAARPFRRRDHHGLHARTQSLRPRRSEPTRFVTGHSRPAEGRNRWAGCYIAPASPPLSALRDRRKRDPHRRGRPDSPVPEFVRSGRPGRGENYTATFAEYQAKA